MAMRYLAILKILAWISLDPNGCDREIRPNLRRGNNWTIVSATLWYRMARRRIFPKELIGYSQIPLCAVRSLYARTDGSPTFTCMDERIDRRQSAERAYVPRVVCILLRGALYKGMGNTIVQLIHRRFSGGIATSQGSK